MNPRYGARSLDRVFPSVAGVLGVPGHVDVLGLPDRPRFVVVVVDGMGDALLREHATDAPFLASMMTSEPLTCGVPSTTATSLTSIGTGLAPGQHGVVGYTSRVPETGRLMNLLRWDQPVDPVAWQPHPTVLSQMAAAGVAANVVNQAEFEKSGLTMCSQRDVPFHGVKSTWERLDVVVDCVEEAPRSVVYAYESRLDHTGHGHGVASQEWLDTLGEIDRDLQMLAEELPADCALVVTADHGMIDLPDEGRFDLDSVHGLRDDVELVGGEARFRHLYVRPGAADDVAARWRATLGDRADVRTQAEAAEWFGPVDPAVSGRIGDVVVASLGDFAVFDTRVFAIEMKMRGFHGSVTPEEMQVPLLVRG